MPVDLTTGGSSFRIVYDQKRIDLIEAELKSCTGELATQLLQIELNICKEKFKTYSQADAKATRALGKTIVDMENLKAEQEKLGWAIDAFRIAHQVHEKEQTELSNFVKEQACNYMNAIRDKVYHLHDTAKGFVEDFTKDYRLYDLKGFVAKQEATKEEWDACVNGIQPWYPPGFWKVRKMPNV
jgi:putative alpha-1,2-mannosidase